MATAHSVTRWLEQLKEGDRQAAQHLWQRYFSRLVRLARTWFPGTPTTAASAEDAALDAFASFCRRAEEDGFAHLCDRGVASQTRAVRSAATLIRRRPYSKR
jgi:hypothetical protein